MPTFPGSCSDNKKAPVLFRRGFGSTGAKVRLRAHVSQSPRGLRGFRGGFRGRHHGADLCGRDLPPSTAWHTKFALNTVESGRAVTHKPSHEPPQPFRIAGHRRQRAHRQDHDAPRRGADAGVHARGHGWRDEGRALARRARSRYRHRARQHLSFDAAAGSGTHRRARRPAALHGMERPDADGLRRLPGDVAVGSAQGQRDRRHLPLAYRRHQGRAVAGAIDRGAAPARLRHRHADGRVRAAAGRARRHRAGDGPVAALGRAQPSRVRAGAARSHAVRHRAGRRRAGAAAAKRARHGRRPAFTVTPSAGLRSASRRR